MSIIVLQLEVAKVPMTAISHPDRWIKVKFMWLFPLKRWKLEIKSSNQKLFNPDDACILAYGQLTLTENFGPDGGLEKIEIPIEYYDRAKNHKPKYLVIVCSASKYGDYFSGGPDQQCILTILN